MVAKIAELDACPSEHFSTASPDRLISFPDRHSRLSSACC